MRSKYLRSNDALRGPAKGHEASKSIGNSLYSVPRGLFEWKDEGARCRARRCLVFRPWLHALRVGRPLFSRVVPASAARRQLGAAAWPRATSTRRTPLGM